MHSRRKKTLRITSIVLLAGGVYLLLTGGRELILPWWHQKQAAKEWHPAPLAPPVDRPPSPRTLDHRLFHPGDTVAELSIPRLHGQWYVVEGSDDENLRLGPGHLQGSAFPGEKGNCVIAGHRDTQFRVLKDIRKGDEILLRTSVGESRYRVTGYDIVMPTDTRSLMRTPDARLNLVTCYPFYYAGNAPKRFIVHAEQAPVQISTATGYEGQVVGVEAAGMASHFGFREKGAPRVASAPFR